MKRLFYCDHHEIPLPPGHRFPVRKYRLIRDLLTADGCFDFREAPLADPGVIAAAHDPDYVTQFLEGSLPPSSVRRIGFPWSEGLVRRTLASVGGTLAATREAFEHGWGGTLAGGTHHAFYGEGSGYCVFNDFAIAIVSLRAAGLIRKAAIIDLDVHQGDGTAQMFEGDPNVLTFSMHGAKNFPFRKQRSRIDVELADGTADAEYLDTLALWLPRIFEFAPDVVFFQSGVDALAEDTLGRLALTHDGLRRRDELVLGACRTYGAPVVLTLGGGYASPIELTANAHANTFRTAAALWEIAESARQFARKS
ncbi:MAG: histone deacetylase [Bryobacteraceae bacterium]